LRRKDREILVIFICVLGVELDENSVAGGIGEDFQRELIHVEPHCFLAFRIDLLCSSKVADYAAALLRHDRFSKRVLDSQSRDAAGIIARYVYPDISTGVAIVEASAPFIDPKVRIDIADIERQLSWYQAQGFVEKTVEARDVVDLSFTAGN